MIPHPRPARCGETAGRTVLPLSQARQAYEQGAKGHTRGKIVLRVVDQGNLGAQPLLV